MESKLQFSIEINPQIKNSLMLLQQTNIIPNELLNDILELALKNILTPHKLNSKLLQKHISRSVPQYSNFIF